MAFLSKRYVSLFVGMSFMASCTHNSFQTAENEHKEMPIVRDIASEPVVPQVNPVSGKTYLQEYREMTNPDTKKKAKKMYVSDRTDGDLLLNEILPGTRRAAKIIAAEKIFAGKNPELYHFLVWMRSSPISTFKAMRNNPQNAQMPAGIYKFSSFTDRISDKKYPVGDTYVITKMNDVLEVLENPKVFSVRNYRDKMKNSVGNFLMSYDMEAINMAEKPWMRKLLPASDLPKIRSMVRDTSLKVLEDQRYIGNDISGKEYGRLEAVNQFARRVPILLVQEYFGLKNTKLSDLYFWSRATQDDFFHNLSNDAKVREKSVIAGKQMSEYLKDYIPNRKNQIKREMAAYAKGSDKYKEYYDGLDILSRLLIDGDLTDDELKNERIGTNVMGTLVGSVETTQATVVQAFEELSKRPEWFKYAVETAKNHELAMLSGNTDLAKKYMDIIEKIVWEALRFKALNPIVVRYAEKEYKLNGVSIPAGSLMLVSTHSAMFDEEYFPHGESFDIKRAELKEFEKLKNLPYFDDAKQPQDNFHRSENQANSSKWLKFKKSYFQLGYGHHRCLGDYIGEIYVPEMVAMLLKLPNVRTADGQAGKLDFRSLRATSGFGDKYYFSFPESFVLEFDTKSSFKSLAKTLEKKSVEVADKDYPFEDYLKDHDRNLYRQCLAGWDVGVDSEKLSKNKELYLKYISKAGVTHDLNWNGENKDLLFCRMPRAFQQCMATEEKNSFNHLKGEEESKGRDLSDFDKHLGAFEKCSKVGNLSSTQTAFYENVFFKKEIDYSKVTTQHLTKPPQGYEFENILKHYTRFNSRESMLNPLGWLKIPDSRIALLYTRLELGFRLCYGKKVNMEKMPEDKAYFACRDGVYFPKQFDKVGGLSLVERYYMLKFYMGENKAYEFLKEIKGLEDVPVYESKLEKMSLIK